MSNAILKAFVAKDAKLTGNTLACIPSVMGVLDSYDDVIFPGAFTPAIPSFLKRGFNPLSHGWTWEALVGYPTVAREEGNKLYGEFVFHSDQASQDALTKCRERIEAGKDVGLSVGFILAPGQYLYFDSGESLLTYAKQNGYDLKLFDVKGIRAHEAPCSGILLIEELLEWSLTPVPANPQAMAIAVKSAPQAPTYLLSARDARSQSTTRDANTMTNRLKSICGARDLPLAPRDRAWSATDAIKRVKAFTKADDAPNAAFAKAFVVLSGPNDEFSSYHLPHADVIDGELRTVPRAVFAIAGALSGARGGADLSDKDREGAKRWCEAQYARISKADGDEIKAPWDDEGEKSGAATVPVYKGQFLGDYVEYSMCMSALTQAHYALMDQAGAALTKSAGYAGMEDDDIMDCLSDMFDEHKDLCMSVLKAIQGGKGAETPTEAAKSVQRLMLSLISVGGLGSGLPFATHACAAADATRSFIERSSERAEKRLKDGRELSEANRGELRKLRESLAEHVTSLDDLLARTEPKGAAKAAELKAHLLKMHELKAKALAISPV